MPTYVFECPQCGEQREKFTKMADRPKWLICPNCHKHMYRILTPFGAHTWTPLELEMETNKLRTFDSKKDLRKECERLGKQMPAWDIM